MAFASLKTRGQKPVPLKRKSTLSTTLSRQKPKLELFESIAMVVSIDNQVDQSPGSTEMCPFCLVAKNANSKDAGCKRNFPNVHEEADTIAKQAFKRFDNEVIQLKNPNLSELQETFTDIKQRFEENPG